MQGAGWRAGRRSPHWGAVPRTDDAGRAHAATQQGPLALPTAALRPQRVIVYVLRSVTGQTDASKAAALLRTIRDVPVHGLPAVEAALRAGAVSALSLAATTVMQGQVTGALPPAAGPNAQGNAEGTRLSCGALRSFLTSAGPAPAHVKSFAARLAPSSCVRALKVARCRPVAD